MILFYNQTLLTKFDQYLAQKEQTAGTSLSFTEEEADRLKRTQVML